MLMVPIIAGLDLLMRRGLPGPPSPGGPLEDELLVGVVARLGRLTGLSGRQLSRPGGG